MDRRQGGFLVEKNMKEQEKLVSEHLELEQVKDLVLSFRERENTTILDFMQFSSIKNRLPIKVVRNFLDLSELPHKTMQQKRREVTLYMVDQTTRKVYSHEFEKKATIYFGKQPGFEEILERISIFINTL